MYRIPFNAAPLYITSNGTIGYTIFRKPNKALLSGCANLTRPLLASFFTADQLNHSLLTLTLISSPLKELPKALPLGPKQKNPPNQPRLALVLVWKCSLLVGHAQWGQIRRDNNSNEKKGSSVRRSCNELVIYYAPSWRGLINGQRIGSDLAGMSALIGRVRSSTAFAKLMQIMRASTRWWCKRCRWWASGWWWECGGTYQCRPNESSGPKRILWVRLSGHKSS